MQQLADSLRNKWLLWIQSRNSFLVLTSLEFLYSKDCIKYWDPVMKTCLQAGTLPDSSYFWLSVSIGIALIILCGWSSYYRLEKLGHPGILGIPWASLFVMAYFKWFSVKIPEHLAYALAGSFLFIGLYLSFAKERTQPPSQTARA